MRPTISALRGWNLDALSKAADTARDNARTLDASLDSCDRVFNDASGWFGKTHDAARIKVDQELDHGREVRNVLNRLSDDAEDAGRTLKHAKEYTLQDVDAAIADGFTVTDTGEVSHSDPKKEQAAADHQRRIQSGLDEVARLDEMYGRKLREAVNDLEAMRDGQQDVTLPSGEQIDPDALVDRVRGMSEEDRRAFLESLPPETVHQMVIADPEFMGNNNGVPFDVRADANEINIRNALTDELQRPSPDQARIDQLRAMLAPMDDPFATIPAGGSPADFKVDRKFVMFSTEGNGRMIEQIGDLKPGAPGVGVYVPGTNTNLNGSRNNHDSAVNLAKQSGSPVFLYMENDFPQGLDKATDPSYGLAMAPQLVSFGKELDAEVARHAPGTPTTYIGHSYGGSVVGTAEQMGLRADRVLYASSAGTGILSTEWHNPNPNVQRFSMTAPGDLIGAAQLAPRDSDIPTRFSPFPGVNLDLPPVIPRAPDGDIGNPHAGNPLGGDPDSIPGVTRLDTGYYSDDNKDHPGEVVFGPNGHGSYWDDPKSDAFQNMANVIKGGEVTTYVERGIESNNVDINIGDDSSLNESVKDIAKAYGDQWLSGAKIGPFTLPTNPKWEDPYGNPHVTDNPGLGRKVQVR
ncbi:alpha/beta hydrolase [Mycobacteroides saopaulense]|uniref:DUF1023 domain-containing protein n=1 Tax=Mycobacteroides saopaulense TaxID=1578165 RepID=A0A1S1JGY6_9MYCO|nr:alpha/beta hydrolase [Mycobacteroides saopaulense]ALR10286.1 hypothetical protein MYCSP_01050 [Mycobacteroides saopaulense]OHT83111.1 hypothetical protein BKG68_17075 [Mycobacteroides saopaulense]OHU09812.1 hypothetical protein BKG73_11740 [Mycobacteroides saopaulense]ORB58437.1 hypothetical protein BST43_10560 [Mycobacteroides saopaulense]